MSKPAPWATKYAASTRVSITRPKPGFAMTATPAVIERMLTRNPAMPTPQPFALKTPASS
jgi:hypothetical protein